MFGDHGVEVGRPFLVLGEIATRRGDRNEALAAFDRGIRELGPDSAAGRNGQLLRADALHQFNDHEGAWEALLALQPLVPELGVVDASRYRTLYAEVAQARGDEAARRSVIAQFESPLPDRDPGWIARRNALSSR